MNNRAMRPSDIVTIKKFVLLETGTYNDQFLRSYKLNADGEAINFIADMVAQNKDGNIHNSSLGQIASGIIAPDSHVTGQVNIDNGWGTKRYSFYLELVYRTSDLSNAITMETILGYTNFKDVSTSMGMYTKNNLIDFINPDTRFYITAINTTKMSQIQGLNHNVNDTRSIQRRQLLMNNNFKLSDNNYNPINPVLATPSIVFNRLASAPMIGNYNDEFIGSKEVNNTIGNITNYIPAYNDRNNNSSTLFLSTLINGFKNAKLDSELDHSNSTGVPIEDTYSDAYNKVNDIYSTSSYSNYNNDPIIITKINMLQGGTNRNSFTLGILNQIDPNYRNVTTIINDNGNMGLSMRGNTADWNSPDPNTMFAVTLANSIPTYMLKCLLVSLSFSVTNQNVGNEITFDVNAVDAKSYCVKGDIYNLINAFKNSLLNEVIRGYTQDFNCGFYIRCSVNILLEIAIEVSINGLPMTPYITPAFSDNLIAPTITTSDGLTNLLSELNNLFTEIDHSINQTNAYTNRVITEHNVNTPSIDYNQYANNNYNL